MTMTAERARELVKDCCPRDWVCAKCRDAKIYLRALEGPEVRALLEAAEQTLEFLQFHNFTITAHPFDKALDAFRKAVKPQ